MYQRMRAKGASWAGPHLLLIKTIYGLNQSAMEFWRKLLRVFISMGYARNKYDPCIFY